MSDEKKQLTVAELLARAGRDTTDGEAPRRRRRRSLEEGGVSVAELTGSIPAVKEKPAESRHSSVPIDAPAEAPQPEVKKPEAAKPQVAEPEVKQAAKPEVEDPKLKTDKADKTEKADKADKADKPARPTPATDETAVLDKISDEQVRAEKAAAADKTADKADDKAAPKLAPAPKVEPRPSTPQVTTAEATKTPKTAETAETGVMPKVTAPAAATPAAAAAATTEQPGSTVDVVERDVDKHEDEEYSDVEEKTSIVGVILMAVIGVVLGAVVFKGFELLWDSLSRPVVAGLALLVTVLMVVVVKMLRTSNDGLSMFLAGLVGLVMTFGPLAVVLI